MLQGFVSTLIPQANSLFSKLMLSLSQEVIIGQIKSAVPEEWNWCMGNGKHTLNLLCTFRAHIFIIQIAHLLFLGRGERCWIAGEPVRADYHAV